MKKFNDVRYIILFEPKNMILVDDKNNYYLDEKSGKLSRISDEQVKKYKEKYNYHIETGLLKDAWLNVIKVEYLTEIVGD